MVPPGVDWGGLAGVAGRGDGVGVDGRFPGNGTLTWPTAAEPHTAIAVVSAIPLALTVKNEP